MKPLIYIVAVLAAAGAAVGLWMYIDSPEESTSVSTLKVNAANQNTNSTAGPVQIYVVAIDDGGKQGRLIGCNDSLVNLAQHVTDATSLTLALESLFAYRSTENASYTALNNAQIVVGEAKVENSVATVRLSGAYELDGTCDGPRFVEQITQTVIDFPDVETATITLNDKPLAEVASQSGE
jgi:spore germination protein GerM